MQSLREIKAGVARHLNRFFLKFGVLTHSCCKRAGGLLVTFRSFRLNLF